MEAVSPDQPCYSLRLLQPFIQLLFERGVLPEAALNNLRTLGSDARIHVSAAHAMLESALLRTGNTLIGLEASKKTQPGDVGVLDFVMRSAATPREALLAAGRYMPLLNDALELTLAVEHEHAIVRLASSVALFAVAEDFALCGLVQNQSASWPFGMLTDLTVCFRHDEPPDVAPYLRALGPVRLVFRAPHTGLEFPAHYLDLPLRSGDQRLHGFLREYAENSLSTIPRSESVTARVRRFVSDHLVDGDVSLQTAARELRMSSRTLARRLTEEHTSFRNVVDELRKDIALRSLSSRDVDLAEVARLSGFRESPSFYRAFRRWTKTTPNQYRRRHRGIVRGTP